MINKQFKGTVNIISSDLLFKEGHSRFTTVPLNLGLIKNDGIFWLFTQHLRDMHTEFSVLDDQSKVLRVPLWARCTSLNGRSLEIKLTVPLKVMFTDNYQYIHYQWYANTMLKGSVYKIIKKYIGLVEWKGAHCTGLHD